MAAIAILYCKRIKDHSCVGCAKCFKGIREKNGEFARHDEIDLVAMTDCGDCPGLVIPRVRHLAETAKMLQRPLEVLHFGTCIKSAMRTAQCPIDVEVIKPILEERLGLKVIIGTHTY